jgi:hypothetical protein
LTIEGFQGFNMSPHCHPTTKEHAMTRVTLKKACDLTSKSKRTIQRYMANGKLSYKTNDYGHKEIDTSELIRVFGDLSPPVNDKVRPDVTPIMSPPVNDVRVDKLLLAVERLEKVINKQSEQIASLLKLEHKSINEPVHNIQATKDQAKTSKPSNRPPRPNTIPPSKNDGYAAKHGLPGNITEEQHKQIMELSKQGLSGPKITQIIPLSKSTINRVILLSN